MGTENVPGACDPSINPHRFVLVLVVVIVIETSNVEHEDEN